MMIQKDSRSRGPKGPSEMLEDYTSVSVWQKANELFLVVKRHVVRKKHLLIRNIVGWTYEHICKTVNIWSDKVAIDKFVKRIYSMKGTEYGYR